MSQPSQKPPTPGNRYDVTVIGAGHNGLVAATLMARRGRKVLVLEKTASVGGLAAGSEFHPGFHSPGILHDTTHIRRWVIEALGLATYGLKLRLEETPVYIPQREGRGFLLWKDPQKAEEELAPLAPRDVQAYRDYRVFLARITPFMRKVFDEFPPDVGAVSLPGVLDLMRKALALRLLGKNDMMEILRIAPMCVADWLNEWFQSDLLKAALAGPALFSSYTGPWSPGTNANLLLESAASHYGVEGGPRAFAAALQAAALAAGVEIRTLAEVKQILIKGGAAQGVQLADGTVVDAGTVAAACDPKQVFLRLVDPSHITLGFEHHIRNVRSRGTTAKVHLALSSYPELKKRPSLKAEFIRTGEYFDQMERAFDAVKYRQMSGEPLLDICVPTLSTPSLAPAGQHVMSVFVHFAPYQLDGGWTDLAHHNLYQSTLRALSHHMPSIESLILGKEVLSPQRLEARYNLTGGHLFHGEHAADQMLVRPTPECARYQTPIAGLFLCGSGSHPGGGLTGAPGAFAAQAMGA